MRDKGRGGVAREEEEEERNIEACSVRRSGMILKTLSTHCNPSPY